MVMSERASFPLAVRLRGEMGAPIGEVFSFLSGLYFRGKVTYARAFAAPPDPESPISGPGVFVITPTAGLRSADTLVTLDALRRFATVDVDAGNPKYRRPLERSARAIGPTSAIVTSCCSEASLRRSTWTSSRESSATGCCFRPISSAAAT